MEHFLETWGYVAVFALSFISSMGLPVGAEVAIIYGGVLASGQVAGEPHHLNVVVVILIATLAEVLGSWPATSSAPSEVGPWSIASESTCSSRTETSTVPKRGSPNGATQSSCSGGSFRSSVPLSPSPPGSARWPLRNS